MGWKVLQISASKSTPTWRGMDVSHNDKDLPSRLRDCAEQGYRITYEVLRATCLEAAAALSAERDSEHVAWCRYNDHNGARPVTIHLCDSDAPGAFKVYRAPASSERASDIALRAWQEAFGTTQLTHAIARLEAAEKSAASATLPTDQRVIQVRQRIEGWRNEVHLGDILKDVEEIVMRTSERTDHAG
jgi:hypothetical protein